MTLDLHATPQEVMRAVETFQEFAEARQVPEKIIFGLALALEECASNIVNHGLRRDDQKKFQVTLEQTPDALIIELRDSGPAFDPTAVAQRGPHEEEDDPLGGWGVQLVRRYTDKISYQRQGNTNVLRLIKGLTSKPG